LHQRVDRALVGQVGLDGDSLNAARLKISYRRRRFSRRCAVVNRQDVIPCGKRIGNMPADTTAAATSDQGDFGERAIRKFVGFLAWKGGGL